MPTYTAPENSVYRFTNVITGTSDDVSYHAGQQILMVEDEYATILSTGESFGPRSINPMLHRDLHYDHIDAHARQYGAVPTEYPNRHPLDPLTGSSPGDVTLGISNGSASSSFFQSGSYQANIFSTAQRPVQDLDAKIEQLELQLAEQKKLINFLIDTLDEKGLIREPKTV